MEKSFLRHVFKYLPLLLLFCCNNNLQDDENPDNSFPQAKLVNGSQALTKNSCVDGNMNHSDFSFQIGRDVITGDLSNSDGLNACKEGRLFFSQREEGEQHTSAKNKQYIIDSRLPSSYLYQELFFRAYQKSPRRLASVTYTKADSTTPKRYFIIESIKNWITRSTGTKSQFNFNIQNGNGGDSLEKIDRLDVISTPKKLDDLFSRKTDIHVSILFDTDSLLFNKVYCDLLPSFESVDGLIEPRFFFDRKSKRIVLLKPHCDIGRSLARFRAELETLYEENIERYYSLRRNILNDLINTPNVEYIIKATHPSLAERYLPIREKWILSLQKFNSEDTRVELFAYTYCSNPQKENRSCSVKLASKVDIPLILKGFVYLKNKKEYKLDHKLISDNGELTLSKSRSYLDLKTYECFIIRI